MSRLNEAEIINLYTVDNLSTKAIAEKFDTYPNMINRILKRNGIPLKDRSTAQRIALAEGRIKHPTKGLKRDEATKLQIASSTYNRWQNMSEQDKEKISEGAKEQWKAMSEEDRDTFRRAAAVGIRKAATEGSKIEKMLLDKLQEDGYTVLFHTKQLMAGTELELDFYFPALKVVLEIDGPAHFFPIWGETALQKKIKSDTQKSGLILSQGMVLLRVKYMSKNTSKLLTNRLYKQLAECLNEIDNSFPVVGKRLIELEVK